MALGILRLHGDNAHPMLLANLDQSRQLLGVSLDAGSGLDIVDHFQAKRMLTLLNTYLKLMFNAGIN